MFTQKQYNSRIIIKRYDNIVASINTKNNNITMRNYRSETRHKVFEVLKQHNLNFKEFTLL